MSLHWLQHVPFEGLGIIETWARERGVAISCTRLFAGEELPDPGRFDRLVVMGGPMGIYDHADHPWLVAEKDFIRQAIADGKTVLGICLGAQLLADVLGATVRPGPHKEIGWGGHVDALTEYNIVLPDGYEPAILPEAFSWQVPNGAGLGGSGSTIPNAPTPYASCKWPT